MENRVAGKVKERPAETGGIVAGAFAGLIAKVAGIDDADTILYLTILVGFVPAAITWVVDAVHDRRESKPEPAA